jgi:hypothetical protein
MCINMKNIVWWIFSYETMQPGYTHAVMINFENAETLNAYMGSGALQGIVGASPVGSADPAAAVFAYVF